MNHYALKARYTYLSKGDKSQEVRYLQEDLIFIGFYEGIAITGEFDTLTEMSVRSLQFANNLIGDGIVGPNTIAVINEYLCNDITEKLDDLMSEVENKYSYVDSNYGLVPKLKLFYSLVKNRAPYDLKNIKGWKAKRFVYNGELLANDAPGNILYGYLGKVFGFSDLTLLSAAGFAQIKAGTSTSEWKNLKSFGDDPRDQARIKQGIQIYKARH